MIKPASMEIQCGLSCKSMANLCCEYDQLEQAYKRARGLGSVEYAAWKACAEQVRKGVEQLQHLLGEGNDYAAAPLAYFNTWALLRPEGFTTC